MFGLLCVLTYSNGFYSYLVGGTYVKLYTDFSRPGEQWIRLFYKLGSVAYPTLSGFSFGIGHSQSLIDNIVDIGWSDSTSTIFREQSWIIRNVSFSTTYILMSNLPLHFSHMLNGKTPTGTTWSSSYSGAYVYYNGRLETFGSWSSMFVGCSNYATVGTNRVFRTGGENGEWKYQHVGEYIHSSCADYTTNSNSVTSLSSWSNNRVFWVKVKPGSMIPSNQPQRFVSKQYLFFVLIAHMLLL